MHDNIASLAGDEATPSLVAPDFFTASIAHAVILGASIFGLFWGVVNALLVSPTDPPISFHSPHLLNCTGQADRHEKRGRRRRRRGRCATRLGEPGTYRCRRSQRDQRINDYEHYEAAGLHRRQDHRGKYPHGALSQHGARQFEEFQYFADCCVLMPHLVPIK